MINENEVIDIIKDVAEELKNKKNSLRIEYDDLCNSIDYIKKQIDYKCSNDSFSVFSPRDNNDCISNLDKMNKELSEVSSKFSSVKSDLDYYSDLCSKINKALSFYNGVDFDNNNVFTVDSDNLPLNYNLNLNYSLDDNLVNRLILLERKLEMCLRIFDNDYERTRNELEFITDSFCDLINSLSNK